MEEFFIVLRRAGMPASAGLSCFTLIIIISSSYGKLNASTTVQGILHKQLLPGAYLETIQATDIIFGDSKYYICSNWRQTGVEN